MRKLILLLTFILLTFSLCAETIAQQSFDGISKNADWDHVTVEKTTTRTTAPIVSNLTVSQRTDGSKLVDIYYDLFDADNDLCEVSFKLSSDDGATNDVLPTAAYVSGDFGEDISSGAGKHIVWDAGEESFNLDGSYLYRVNADDGSGPPMPENFVLVEGGTIYPSEGFYISGLTVSSFYIDKYELTNAEWNSVMGSGGGDNYPKAYVSWFNAIEYCNRRSILEGLSPNYSYLTYGTNPANWPVGWNDSSTNQVDIYCDFSATGYRLPSEAEWEYAARGGLQTLGYTYSGNNNLEGVGWYGGNSGYNSHAVGQLAPNEMVIYDMSGNLWEWCWDVYDYDGSYRVSRGGSFNYDAIYCVVSFRNYFNTSRSSYNIGFRCVRVSP